MSVTRQLILFNNKCFVHSAGAIKSVSLKDATCTYSWATLPGDSGAALCLVGGKVVAIHQQGENPLQEVPKGARESQVVLETVISTQRGYDQQGVGLLACAIAEELQERP